MRPIFLSITMCLLRLQIYPQMILLMQNIEFFYQSSKGTCLNPCNAKVWIRVGLFRILTPSNDNKLRFLIANMHNHHKEQQDFFLCHIPNVYAYHFGIFSHSSYKHRYAHCKTHPIRGCVYVSFPA